MTKPQPYPPPWKQGLCFFDLETTGVNVQECALIEIGAVTDDGGTFEAKLALTPAERLAFSEGAMRVNGYTDEEWQGALEPAAALSLFESFAWGYCLVSFNGGNFDQRIMRRHLGEDRYHALFRATIDVYQIARRALPGPKYNLSACCAAVGIEGEGVHRALGGAQRCQALFGALVSGGRGAPAMQGVQRVASEF